MTVTAVGVRSSVRVDRRWPMAAVSLAVAAGHNADGADTHGLAHVCEHLLMRQRWAGSSQDLFEWVGTVGGLATASTHPDHTGMTLLVPPDAVPTGLRRLAALLIRPSVSTSILASEVDKVQDEICALGPERGLPWGVAAAALSGGSPGLADGQGDPAQLRSLTPARVAGHLREHYTVGNAVLAVVGDVAPVDLQRLIDGEFRAASPTTRAPHGDGPLVDAARRIEVERRTSAGPGALVMAYAMPPIGENLDDYLATVVLTGVVANRLNAAPGQAGSTSFRAGLFGSPLTVRRGDLALAIRRVTPSADHGRLAGQLQDSLADLAVHPPTQAEVDTAANAFRLTQLHSLDTPDGYAGATARLRVLLSDSVTPDLPADLIAVITPIAVSRMAAHLLTGPSVEIRVTGDRP